MEEPDCPKEIAGLYNSTYRLVLKDMIDQEITASELTEIISTAMLCPSEFGDVVFWARGILSKRSESYTYNDLDCESVNAEIDLREKANLAIDKSEIIITPNPAINHFRLENRSSFKTLNVRINDLDGNLFGQEILEDKIEIDCSEFTEGLYIVSISHQSGYNTIKRIIVIN